MHTLEEAQNYIEQNRIDKRKRPAFHVTAPVGWINDPNGFQLTKIKYICFINIIPIRQTGDQCTGGMLLALI